MPSIRPSADLRNKYGEISDYCHSHHEPVFITKNGKGDLAVMSIETYELLLSRQRLYSLIDEGLEAEHDGRASEAAEVTARIRKKSNC